MRLEFIGLYLGDYEDWEWDDEYRNFFQFKASDILLNMTPDFPKGIVSCFTIDSSYDCCRFQIHSETGEEIFNAKFIIEKAHLENILPPEFSEVEES